jgi:sulfite reductase alpha subunit-like flavoprotein
MYIQDKVEEYADEVFDLLVRVECNRAQCHN